MENQSDVIYEAALWRLNKHNEYKTEGRPSPDAKIYDSLIKHLEDEKGVALTISKDSYSEFLLNMKHHSSVIEFAERYLTKA